MKIIVKTPADFEVFEDTTGIVTFPAMLVPMKAREVNRKPEGERSWRWVSMWSTTKVEIDTVLQGPDGIEYRVQGITDWSQGGFYETDLTEQPRGL